MMKIPLALANAVTESFPTLVCALSEFLRIRRTQATGGSNSTAVGGPPAVFPAVAPPTVVEAGIAIAEEGVSPLALPFWLFSLEADSKVDAVESAARTLVEVDGLLIVDGIRGDRDGA
jgi:hypothetical protein